MSDPPKPGKLVIPSVFGAKKEAPPVIKKIGKVNANPFAKKSEPEPFKKNVSLKEERKSVQLTDDLKPKKSMSLFEQRQMEKKQEEEKRKSLRKQPSSEANHVEKKLNPFEQKMKEKKDAEEAARLNKPKIGGEKKLNPFEQKMKEKKEAEEKAKLEARNNPKPDPFKAKAFETKREGPIIEKKPVEDKPKPAAPVKKLNPFEQKMKEKKEAEEKAKNEARKNPKPDPFKAKAFESKDAKNVGFSNDSGPPKPQQKSQQEIDDFKANQAKIAAALAMGPGARRRPKKPKTPPNQFKRMKTNIFQEDGDDDLLQLHMNKPKMMKRSRRETKKYQMENFNYSDEDKSQPVEELKVQEDAEFLEIGRQSIRRSTFGAGLKTRQSTVTLDPKTRKFISVVQEDLKKKVEDLIEDIKDDNKSDGDVEVKSKEDNFGHLSEGDEAEKTKIEKVE